MMIAIFDRSKLPHGGFKHNYDTVIGQSTALKYVLLKVEQILDLNPSTLRGRIRKLGIQRP
jgi:hypothetical protein